MLHMWKEIFLKLIHSSSEFALIVEDIQQSLFSFCSFESSFYQKQNLPHMTVFMNVFDNGCNLIICKAQLKLSHDAFVFHFFMMFEFLEDVVKPW